MPINCRYLKEQFPKKTIRIVRFYRDKIPDWKSALMRLYNDAMKSAHYSYQNEANRGIYEKLYDEPITKCEIEQLGYKMGALFVKLENELCHTPNSNTLDSVYEGLGLGA